MKKLTLVIFGLMVHQMVIAQLYPQQTMYVYNAMANNAAATGQHEALNITLSHRTMWQGLDGAPKTQYFSMSSPLKKENISIGLQISRDKIGVSSRNNIQASGAYRLKLGRGKIAFGISAGVASVNNAWSQIVTTESNDNSFSSGDIGYYLPSAGAGLYYEDALSFLGFSVPQFFTETYVGGNEYKAVSQFSNNSYHIMAGHKFILSKNIRLTGSTLVKYHTHTGVQTDLTAIMSYVPFFDLGFTVRPKDALSGFTRISINEQMKIGYSYDYQLNKLVQYNKGTHELTLNYIFMFNNNSPSPRLF